MNSREFYNLLCEKGFKLSIDRCRSYRKELGLDSWDIKDIPLYLIHAEEAYARRQNAGRKTKGCTHVAWNKGIPRTQIEKDNLSKKLKGKKKPPRSLLHKSRIIKACTTQAFRAKMSNIAVTRAKQGRNHFRYKINDLTFDSLWEVYFYLYHLNNNHTIKRNILFKLPHGHTLIDFEIDGILYEIKGPQFFNKKGELIIPYNNPNKIQGRHEKEKQQLWKEKGVIIISDITPYKDWYDVNKPTLSSLPEL